MKVCTPDLEFNAGVTNGFKMFIYLFYACVCAWCLYGHHTHSSAVGGQKRVLDPAA